MERYKEFHKLIDGLISLNKANRIKLKNGLDGCDPVMYAIELCTVRCDIGRRTGKTEYIKQNAGKSDLIVTSSQMLKSSLFANMPCDVITMGDLNKPEWLLGKSGDFKTIWVDEPFMIFDSHKALTEFYIRICRQGKDQTFVFMGR
jgi:hypothetical protein